MCRLLSPRRFPLPPPPPPPPLPPFPHQAANFIGVDQFLLCNYHLFSALLYHLLLFFTLCCFHPSPSLPPGPLSLQGQFHRGASVSRLQLRSSPCSALPLMLLSPNHPSHQALCPYKGNFTGVAQFLVCNYYPPAAAV
ncbi:unnamed protein product [Closterium sp. NIES-54]